MSKKPKTVYIHPKMEVKCDCPCKQDDAKKEKYGKWELKLIVLVLLLIPLVLGFLWPEALTWFGTGFLAVSGLSSLVAKYLRSKDVQSWDSITYVTLASGGVMLFLALLAESYAWLNVLESF